MSLSDELKQSGSWVREFLDSRFRRLNGWVKDVGPEVKASALLVPLDPENRRSAATVGKAIDYRLRLQFGWRPAESRILQDGTALLGWQLREPAERQRVLHEKVRVLLSSILPVDEDGLARAAVILAWLDDAYRRNPPRDGVRRAVAQLVEGAPATWDACGADVEDSLVWEVRALTAVAEPVFGAGGRIVTAGPEFAGSRYVGGADADLVLDHRLVEVKTTIDPRRDLLPASRQLLGYVLLDWSDEHAMEEAGFYFAGQGKQMSWPLRTLIADTTGNPNATLRGLRAEFQQLAREARAQRRRRGSRSEA